MKRKTILIVLSAIVVLIVALAGGFWYTSTRPLYRPGMVRARQNLRAPLSPPAQNGDPDYWQVESDIRLYHFTQGQGRNILVVHGGPGEPSSQPIPGLELLADEYRFYYYDQRGCGLSTRPIDRFQSSNMYQNMTALDQTLGLGAQVADIERIRQILGDDRLILIGHSWGGFLASLYAAEFPERVEALVLISPANTLVMPQPEADSDLFASVRANLPAEKQAEFDTFIDEYLDFNRLFAKSEADLVAMNQKFGEYYAESVGMSLSDQGPRPGGWMVWAQYVSMGKRHDYRKALGSVMAPVLVIHGADDLQSEAASRQYVEAFPNAQIAVIQGASHFAYEQQPAEFARIVENFLGNLK
jgi:proline iminopeptidase